MRGLSPRRPLSRMVRRRPQRATLELSLGTRVGGGGPRSAARAGCPDGDPGRSRRRSPFTRRAPSWPRFADCAELQAPPRPTATKERYAGASGSRRPVRLDCSIPRRHSVQPWAGRASVMPRKLGTSVATSARLWSSLSAAKKGVGTRSPTGWRATCAPRKVAAARGADGPASAMRIGRREC